jgi:hypothetical protein
VKPGREGPTVPVQLRGGLQSPNRTVTSTGTTTIQLKLTCVEDGFRKDVKPWPANQGGVASRPSFGLVGPDFVPHHLLMSYCL